ncbi:hypothetical protein [Mesoplasma lactucae]|uniref:Uncharacterized protein n=1 Tax=Mesoplasma lactucae ATCC 49193 TaxID=81460 RepID=A0A291ISP6_9MOLU|nr:hypothetical protein [Mesoplasma lactucae]ATG97773.1 hypothetical protein CP520_03485 [Mesoplasma lactucae ATCC 49193]ATZ20450.1 hypothetical protein MLACT_v1c06290 [Mesoplasma lactucae ATCC 49193]MCL8216622.1 hypothetical protein [Mesoplasma lactucae ATCC 49193]
MKTTTNQKSDFTRSCSYCINLVLKKRHLQNKRKTNKALEDNLNCYKNFIIQSFNNLDIKNISLKHYLSLLPDEVLENEDRLINALWDLNEGKYIFLRKDLFRYVLTNNDKNWNELPCGNVKEDYSELLKQDNSLKINREINEIDDPRDQLRFDEKEAEFEELKPSQAQEIEQMRIVQNIMLGLFVKAYLKKEKDNLSKCQRKNLEEIRSFNRWVLKQKQKQFEALAKETDHEEIVSKYFDEAIRDDIKQAIFDPEHYSANINYFDKELNKRIEKIAAQTMDDEAWNKLKKSVFEHYDGIFSVFKKPLDCNTKVIIKEGADSDDSRIMH